MKKSAASLYALLSITFWGVSFVSTKAVLDKLDPYTLLVIRFGIGSAFLFVLLVILREKIKISLSYLPHLIILGILGVFIHQVIQATALLTIDASAAGWMISFSPVFTVILSMIFLNEKLSLTKVIGMILAIFGVFLITTVGADQDLEGSLHIGYFLMILSTLNWAVYSVLLKKLRIPFSPLVITFYMSFLGFLLTLPFLLRNRGWEAMSTLDRTEWGHLFFLGIFVSGVAYWYWAKALSVLEASQVSVFLYLEPLATLLAAIFFLQEKIMLISVIGGIIIIIGVIFVNGQVKRIFPFFTDKRK